jgi:hypothetical protein
MTDTQMKYAIVITKIQTNQFVSAITISTRNNDAAEAISQTEKSCCLWKVKVKDPVNQPSNSTSTQLIAHNLKINPTQLPNFIRNNPTVEQIIYNTPETVEAALTLLSFKRNSENYSQP